MKKLNILLSYQVILELEKDSMDRLEFFHHSSLDVDVSRRDRRCGDRASVERQGRNGFSSHHLFLRESIPDGPPEKWINDHDRFQG